MTKNKSKSEKGIADKTAGLHGSSTEETEILDADREQEIELRLMPTDEIIGTLLGQYGEWEPIERRARKSLYRLLGTIYEAIPIFEGDLTKRSELQTIVRKDEEVAKSSRFNVQTADSLDLLLVAILGLGRMTSATKSQWRSALLKGRLEKVEHNAVAYATWLNKKGGMVKAAKEDTDDPSSQDASSVSADAENKLIKPKAFNLDAYLRELSESPGQETVNVELNPDLDLYKGLGVLLVHTPPGDVHGPVQLVKKIGAESVIKLVAREVASGHIRNLSEEESRALAHEQDLWAINKVALILAGRLQAKFDLKALRAFTAALKRIKENDKHQQKYFQGRSGVVFSQVDQFTCLWTMEVANPEFLDVDPGRYFKGGRAGALIPYDVELYGTPEGDETIKEYVSANTEPWRIRPGHAAKAKVK